jgi:hypothetical protein
MEASPSSTHLLKGVPCRRYGRWLSLLQLLSLVEKRNSLGRPLPVAEFGGTWPAEVVVVAVACVSMGMPCPLLLACCAARRELRRRLLLLLLLRPPPWELRAEEIGEGDVRMC